METIATLLGLGVVLAGVVGLVVLYVSRQRTLSHRVASFTCLLGTGAEWQHGIAQFGRDRLVWWRTFSLAPRPERVWSRTELTIVDRAPSAQVDHDGHQLVVLHCRHGVDAFQVLISGPAVAGLVSGLESAPRTVRQVV